MTLAELKQKYHLVLTETITGSPAPTGEGGCPHCCLYDERTALSPACPVVQVDNPFRYGAGDRRVCHHLAHTLPQGTHELACVVAKRNVIALDAIE